MLNLDTHILLGALADELTRRERELLAREPWSVAAIVLWEIGKLAERGRSRSTSTMRISPGRWPASTCGR